MDPKETIKDTAKAVGDKLEEVAEAAVDKAAAVLAPPIPGAPGSEPPPLEEPVQPR